MMGSQPALFNQLVMECVSSYLTFSDWKNCRRVCQTWNEIVTPFLVMKKCIFTISSSTPWDQFGLSKVPAIDLDPRLATRVRIQEVVERGRRIIGQDITTVNKFLEKYCEIITSLEVRASSDSALDLSKVFNNFSFPELVNISIVQTEGGGQPPEKLDYQQSLTKLKSIQFGLDNERFYREWPHPFHPLVQDLINKSWRNLEELRITDNFFPHLDIGSSVSKLRITVLAYTEGWRNTHEDIGTVIDPACDMNKLTKMLRSVKDTLEELELGDRSIFNHRRNPPDNRDFKLAEMPKLQILRIMATDLFHNIVNFLTPEYLPELKTIVMKSFYARKYIDIFISALNAVMPQVTDVTIFWTRKEVTIAKVKYIFPNVKRFTLYVDKADCPFNVAAPWRVLSKLFAMFKDWNHLGTLEIIVSFPCDIISVLIATPSLPFETTKRIKIRLASRHPVEGHTIASFNILLTDRPEMWEALLLMKEMKKFEITGHMPPQLAVGFQSFVTEHELPIHINLI